MSVPGEKVDFNSYYKQLLKQQSKSAVWYAIGVVLAAIFLGFYTQWIPAAILGIVGLLLICVLHRHYFRKYYRRLSLLGQPFPKNWQKFLENNAAFYAKLSPPEKEQFQQRVQFFLA